MRPGSPSLPRVFAWPWAAAPRTSSHTGPRRRPPGLAQTHALAAGVLLVLMLTNRTEPDLMPAGPAAAAALSFLVLAAIGSFAAASRPQTAATEALASTMQIVAAALIGGGCDGRGVRSQLSALLPPSQRPSAAISQAA